MNGEKLKKKLWTTFGLRSSAVQTNVSDFMHCKRRR